MRRLQLCLLLLGLPAAARAQEEPAYLVLNTAGHSAHVQQLLFTPDGQRLVSVGEDRTVQVWSVETGERLQLLRTPTGPNFDGALLAAALAPDGKLLAVAGKGFAGANGKRRSPVLLLDLDAGRVERVLDGAEGAVLAVAFDPADAPRRLAAVDEGGVRLWTLTPGAAHRVLGQGSFAADLAFSPDGTRLATARDADRAVVIWDVTPDRPARELRHWQAGPRVTALAWAPDGKTLATGIENAAVRLWSAEGTPLRRFPRDRLGPKLRGSYVHFPRLHFLANGDLLASWGAARPDDSGWTVGASVLRPGDGSSREAFAQPNHEGDPVRSAVSPDGKVAATAVNPQGKIVLWQVAAGKVQHRLGGPAEVPLRVGWSTDSNTLAWGVPRLPANADLVHLTRGLDLKELRFLRLGADVKFETARERLGAWAVQRTHPDALELTGPDGKKTTVRQLPAITAFTLVPDGRGKALLAAAAGNTWSLIDPPTGKDVDRSSTDYQSIQNMAPSPDGRFLAVATGEAMLALHGLREGRRGPLLKLFVQDEDWIVWTAQGYYAASPGGERLLGWTVNDGLDKLATFHPAARFRAKLYRPDVIRLILEKGSVEEALKAAGVHETSVAQLLPPRATLELLPGAGATKEAVRLRATAAAQALGQRVTSLRLFVDGRPLPDAREGKGLGEWQPGVKKAAAVWEVELPPGARELKVLARSADTAAVSEVVVLPGKRGLKERPLLHLVAVGIDSYRQQGLRLHAAAGDARDLAAAFVKNCAGANNLFRDATGPVLLDDQATREGVLHALKEARLAAKPGDLVVVTFAGHGVKEGGDFYLLPVDADTTKLERTALSGKELRRQLAEVHCPVLLILDACHSAAGVKGFKPATDDAARTLTGDDCGVAVFCAAMGHEEAQAQQGGSLFTRALIEGLSRTDRLPYNYRDGRQYVHHLHAFVLDEVKDLSDDKQHPFLNLPLVTEPFPIRRLPDRTAGAR
jgi:WD40 repeat protein